MSNLNWQTSDGVTLKSIRQSAGIGLSVLARKASLSVEQLKQLEDGGSSLFYTEAIKLRAGERVLEILGFRFTQPLIDPGLQEKQNTVSVASAGQSQQPFNRIIALRSQNRSAPWRVYEWLVQQLSGGSKIDEGLISRLWHSKLFWSATGSMVIGLWGYTLFMQNGQSIHVMGAGFAQWTGLVGSSSALVASTEPSNAIVQAGDSVNTPSKALSLSGASSSSNALAPNVAVNAPTNAPSSASSSAPRSAQAGEPLACAWESSAPSLFALHPSKEGNYVFVVANTKTTLCIRDAQNRITVVSLVEGGSQSVYGQPPFEVNGASVKQLKFYFQGYEIYMPETVNHQFTLLEIPFTKSEHVAQYGPSN